VRGTVGRAIVTIKHMWRGNGKGRKVPWGMGGEREDFPEYVLFGQLNKGSLQL